MHPISVRIQRLPEPKLAFGEGKTGIETAPLAVVRGSRRQQTYRGNSTRDRRSGSRRRSRARLA